MKDGLQNGRRTAARIAAVAFLTIGMSTIGLSPVRGERATLQSVRIDGVPHFHQDEAFSGEACAAMFLSRGAGRVRPSDVFNRAEVDPRRGSGCRPRELRDALRRMGVETGTGYLVLIGEERTAVEREFSALGGDLARGVASIVALRPDPAAATTLTAAEPPRFVLALGYDAATDRILFHDPARRDGASLQMARTDWLRRWPIRAERDRSALVRIALATRRPIVVQRRAGFTAADFAGHIGRLRDKLPSEDFELVVEPPFVVVGDMPRERLEGHATRTVQWAVDRLKQEYFEQDPDKILEIWLFKDKASYERYTWEVFQDRPTTPYGYYSRQHGALIMNIATGGGTLVHEIVHPFMAANFPRCPAWFNEGLASLYEQSSERDGRIRGLTNWRLRGLQLSIRDGRVPSFETLCGTTTREFYNEDSGTNYAQARYLCYYLQEHGLLREYYREFRRSAAKDPGGYQTLRRVLGDPEMDEFQKQWEQFVLKLRF